MATTTMYDVILRGGRVIDPANGVDSIQDVAVQGGKIARVGAKIPGRARKAIDVKGRLVIPGMIDTHGHIYQYVTGKFGMNPDLVGVRSGVTAVVDQGGAAPLTIHGFRKFIVEPAKTRVYSFISNYLVGGLAGHLHVGLYGPHGINVRDTVRAIEENRDIVKGIKCHAEPGGYSRWGIETLKLAKQAAREARVPVYIHLGRLWMEADGTKIDPDSVMAEVVPLLDEGDILAHPFTKHAGAFVSKEGKVHPLVLEAVQRGVRVDVGRGGHMSFKAARIAIDAGVIPFTVGSDVHGYTVGLRDGTGVWDGGTFALADSKKSRKHTEPVGGMHVFSLAQVMNELLALGLRLEDVIAMVTSNAATMIGLEGETGALGVGMAADVSVLGLDSGKWTLEDSLGSRIASTQRLRPEFCLRDGVVLQADSPLLFESTAKAA